MMCFVAFLWLSMRFWLWLSSDLVSLLFLGHVTHFPMLLVDISIFKILSVKIADSA